MLASYQFLDYLDIAGVGLVNVSNITNVLSLKKFGRLSFLKLSSNNISHINESHLDILFQTVTVLDLSSNTFICDCSIIPTVRWFNTNVTVLFTIARNWILPLCKSPADLGNILINALRLGDLKKSCDLLDKCDLLNPSPQLCMNITMITIDHSYGILATTSKPRIKYESILLPYDPMLGWWTAAALSGMIGALILCLILEQAKKKIVAYRRRRYRRKCRTKWEAAKAAASADEADCVSSFPLQHQTPVFYSSEIKLDFGEEVKKFNNENALQTEQDNESISNDLGVLGYVKTDTETQSRKPYSRQSSGRLSVSWGPTSDISTSPGPSPNLSPSRRSTIVDNQQVGTDYTTTTHTTKETYLRRRRMVADAVELPSSIIVHPTRGQLHHTNPLVPVGWQHPQIASSSCTTAFGLDDFHDSMVVLNCQDVHGPQLILFEKWILNVIEKISSQKYFFHFFWDENTI